MGDADFEGGVALFIVALVEAASSSPVFDVASVSASPSPSPPTDADSVRGLADLEACYNTNVMAWTDGGTDGGYEISYVIHCQGT